MNSPHRILIYVPAGLLLLVAILWSVYWRVEADTLGTRLDTANGGEIIPGITFAFAEKSVGGFPFRLDAVLSGVTFAHRGPEGETAWRTEKFALHAMIYGRPLYLFEAAGLQSFAFPPAVAGQVPRVYFLTPGLARASALLRGGGLYRFDLDIVGAAGKEATRGADPARIYSAGRAQLHLLRRMDLIDVAVKIEAGKLGGGFKPAFSGDFPLIELRGTLNQAQAFGQIERGDESVSDAAEHWRKSGGALAVETLTLDWGPVRTNLKGTIGLDDKSDPRGALTGPVDASGVLGTLLRGMFAEPADGAVLLSLQFKDGDIKAGAASAPAATAAPAP